MNTLNFYLFGGLRMSYLDTQEADCKVTRSVKSLLAYLLLNRRRFHPRSVLAGLFWGDKSEDRARCCLSTALWRLRRVLEPEDTPTGTYLITTPSGEVGFNAESDHWLDVAEFEEKLTERPGSPVDRIPPKELGKLECALELYTGDLLEGFYGNWALRERERMRSLYLKNLARLMHCYRQQGEYEKSLGCGHQILAHDPLREGIHREVIRMYAECGHRALAVKQYETCCRILKTEIGVAPMAETRELYSEILEQTGVARTQAPSRDIQVAPVQQARIKEGVFQEMELSQTFNDIHFAMKYLNRAIHQLEGLLIGGAVKNKSRI